MLAASRTRRLIGVTGALGVTGAACLITAAPALAIEASNMAAMADQFDAGVDSDVLGNVLTNDVNPAGDIGNTGGTMTVRDDYTQPEHGRVTISPDGQLTYVAEACQPGDFTSTYTIENAADPTETTTGTVTIHVAGDAVPVKAADDTLIYRDGEVDGNILDNDCGATTPATADSVHLDATPVTAPEHGELTINPDGTFTYTPDDPDAVSDSFTYQINSAARFADTGTVLITDQFVDLSVAITYPTGLDIGKPGTSTITVTNEGTAEPASNAKLTVSVPEFVSIETLPDNAALVADPDTGMPIGATATITSASLAPNKPVEVRISVTVDKDVPIGTTITGLTATIELDEDINGDNDMASTGILGTIVDDGVMPPPDDNNPGDGSTPGGGTGGNGSGMPRGPLANTGSEYVPQLTAGGAALVLAGAGLVVVARRRRPGTVDTAPVESAESAE